VVGKTDGDLLEVDREPQLPVAMIKLLVRVQIVFHRDLILSRACKTSAMSLHFIRAGKPLLNNTAQASNLILSKVEGVLALDQDPARDRLRTFLVPCAPTPVNRNIPNTRNTRNTRVPQEVKAADPVHKVARLVECKIDRVPKGLARGLKQRSPRRLQLHLATGQKHLPRWVFLPSPKTANV